MVLHKRLVTGVGLALVLGCGKSPSAQTDRDKDSGGGAVVDDGKASDEGAGATPGGTAPVEVPGLDALAHKPRLLLYERNPWAMVIGSDVPTFVLYDDGLVIFHREVAGKMVAFEATLDAGGRASLVTDVMTAKLVAQPDRVSVVHATDQPTVELWGRTDRGWILKSVYGIDRQGKPSIPNQGGTPPHAFVSAYQRLLGFDAKDKVEWKPEQLELMLWDFSHAKDAGYEWPEDLPPLPADLVPPERGVKKVTIPGRYEERVRAMLVSKGPRSPLLHNGHKWSVGARRQIPEESYVFAVRKALWEAARARSQ